MTANIWQVKKKQHEKRESFLKGRIFHCLLSLIAAFDADEYSDLRKCLLELAKVQGGELKQDTKWWIQEQARHIRLEKVRSRIFSSVYQER